MENDDLYETPKTNSLIDERLVSFGGWLRFYQVINIISVVFIGIVILAIVAFGFMEAYDDNEFSEAIIGIFEFLPDLIFSIAIIRILTTQNQGIPGKIVKYLGYYLAASLLAYAVFYYLFKIEVVTEKPVSFFGSVFYYFIWSSYFKKSKRVKAYYGENAQ